MIWSEAHMGNYCFWPELQHLFGDWRRPQKLFWKNNVNSQELKKFFFSPPPPLQSPLHPGSSGRKGPKEFHSHSAYKHMLLKAHLHICWLMREPRHYITAMWIKQFKGYKRRGARSRRSAESAHWMLNARPRAGRGCPRSREEELELR